MFNKNLLFLKKHSSNVLLVLVCIFLLYMKTPVILNSFNNKGKVLKSISVINLNGEKQIFPKDNEKEVFIFWTTWCKPCHVQLSLFKKAINNNIISNVNITAVNLGENLNQVQNFVKEKDYPFKVVISQSLNSWQELGVVATPSIAYKNKTGKIESFNSGLSPLAIYKTKRHLRKNNHTN